MSSTGNEGQSGSKSPVDSTSSTEQNARSQSVSDVHDAIVLETDRDISPESTNSRYSDSQIDDDEYERPNRWQGHDSTWRSYIRDERGLNASLDQQEAHDLSLHLFNAHALKAGLYDREAQVKPWASKAKWLRRDENGQTPWHPTPEWTSWPLRPDEVPRSNEAFGTSGEDFQFDLQALRKRERWHPSKYLEEELLALMLKRGKNQFAGRQWGVPMTTARHGERSHSFDSSHSGSRNSSHTRDQSLSHSTVTDTSERSASIASEFNNGELVDDSSQESDDEGGGGDEDENQHEHSAPVFLADDDEAQKILQRPIRHIVTKLDDLLEGLHRSRVGQAAKNTYVRRSHQLSQRTQGTSKRAMVDQEERSDPISDVESVSSSISSVLESPRKRPRLEHRGRNFLGVRDWSEVLGIASMTGWGQSTIDRAAKRCTALFGEDMTFRTLPETAPSIIPSMTVEYRPSQLPDFPSHLTVSMGEVNQSHGPRIPDAENQIEAQASPQYEGQQSELYCVKSSCPRYTKGFTHPFRFREHMKRVHKYTSEMLSSLEHELMPQAKPVPHASAPPDPLVCPIGGCNLADKVFPLARRLVEHLRRAHQYDPRTEGWPIVSEGGFPAPVEAHIPDTKRRPINHQGGASSQARRKGKKMTFRSSSESEASDGDRLYSS